MKIITMHFGLQLPELCLALRRWRWIMGNSDINSPWPCNIGCNLLHLHSNRGMCKYGILRGSRLLPQCMQLVCYLHGNFTGDQCSYICIFNYSDIRIYRRSNWIIGTYCSGYFPVNSVYSLFDYALEVSRGAVKR